MTKKIKLNRKKIKSPDEFLTLTGRFLNWVGAHRVPILAAFAGVAVAALIAAGVVALLTQRQGKALDAMAEADDLYRAPLEQARSAKSEEGAAKPAMTPDEAVAKYKEAAGKYVAVADRYAHSDAGKLSLLYAGDAYFRAGEIAESIGAYEKFVRVYSGNPLLKGVGYEGLGYAYEAKGEFAQAAEAFEKTVDPSEKVTRPFGLLNAARCRTEAGDPTKAISLYEQFLQEYPDSELKAVASERLAALKAGVGAPQQAGS